MPGKTSRTIQVVSHGPSCLDGVMAAAAVARFYDGHKVFTTLAGNNDADRTIRELTLKSDDGGDEIWITDLSWNSPETGARLVQAAGDENLLGNGVCCGSLAGNSRRLGKSSKRSSCCMSPDCAMCGPPW